MEGALREWPPAAKLPIEFQAPLSQNVLRTYKKTIDKCMASLSLNFVAGSLYQLTSLPERMNLLQIENRMLHGVQNTFPVEL